MRLLARCDLTVDCPRPCPVVAMLRPRSGLAQWVVSERYALDTGQRPREYEDAFGNACQRFLAPAGRTRIAVRSEVEVDERLAVDADAAPTPVDLLPDQVLVYLLQSRYCPSDKLEDQARAIAGQAAPGYAQVEAIRAWIRAHHAYRYGVSTVNTDALDTMAAKAGVCRDFAHVGVALCRALRIPARIVVGYLYRLDPMDLHAWFEAFVGGRWYTFDATQEEARGGRIVLAYGRDAADVAFLSNYADLEVVDMQVGVERVDG
ncbi:transglutaminase domain-containing protein [Pseudorhodoferax sp.]|uniref:transglutaminase domain-containing protein n=1 Tax=Pseudorhodoferax sp. TaxID=1993553 RepID=UPI0039E6538C